MGAGSQPEIGYAPHYAPGLMQRVAARRGMEPTACMVSSATHPLGTWLWVWGEKTRVLRLCRVTDISAPNDQARHRRTKRLVELSWESAADLCGSTTGPSKDCPVRIWVAE